MSAKNILAVVAFVFIAVLSASLSYQLISPPPAGDTQKVANKLSTAPNPASPTRPPGQETVAEKAALPEPGAEQERIINGAEYSSGTKVGAPPQRAAQEAERETAAEPQQTADTAAVSEQTLPPAREPASESEADAGLKQPDETQQAAAVQPPLPEQHPTPRAPQTRPSTPGPNDPAEVAPQERQQAGFSPDGCARKTTASAYKTADFTLTEKIGQMLIIGFQGASPGQNWPQTVVSQIREGWVGGVLFLGHNVKSAAGVKGLLRRFNGAGGRLSPFLMVDQEGGLVQRLGPQVGWKKLQAAESVARTRTPAEAYELYRRTAAVLGQWGFNTNLAPVVDVNVYKQNPIIGRLGRAYSDQPREVVQYAQAFIQAHRDEGMLTSVKHFPGHGSSRRDSHKGFTDISTTWQPDVEVAPFQDLIRNSCVDMIMTGHLFLEKYQVAQAGDLPATLSPPVIQTLLRDQIGYDGVIVTDDMEMGAIRQHFGQQQAVLQAIRAGNDLIMVSNTANPDPQLPEKLVRFIAAEAKQDPGLMERINQSFQRIVRLKTRLAVGQ